MKFLSLFSILFCICFVSAIPICIDHDNPSAPSNLVLSSSGNNIQLNWSVAVDSPTCSGISHYEIYRNGNLLNSTNETIYSDSNLAYGTYEYTIHAIDLVENEGNGISSSISLTSTISLDDGDDSSGGGGGSSNSIWDCDEWGECMGNISSRNCVDIAGEKLDRIETKECISSFISEIEENSNETSFEESLEEKTGFSLITGRAIQGINQAVKSPPAVGFLCGIFLLGFFIFIRKRKLKKVN